MCPFFFFQPQNLRLIGKYHTVELHAQSCSVRLSGIRRISDREPTLLWGAGRLPGGDSEEGALISTRASYCFLKHC